MGGRAPFEHIGTAITVLRARAGFRQSELARAAGVTRAQVSNYECGRQRPTLDSLEKIMMALGADIFDLASALQEADRSASRLREGEGEGEAPGAEPSWAGRQRALREVGVAVERFLGEVERAVEARQAGGAE